MNPFRRLAVAIAFTFFAALPISSIASSSTDFTDLWWNPSESGWGVTITQNSDVLFLTFFVYGADGKPYWVTATANYMGTSPNGLLVFTGDLYETSGPWLGGQFNAALVNAHKVGTVSFYGQYIEAGQLSYTVNGTTVYKQIERQLLREENLSGSYYVANVGTTYDCTNPAANKTAQVVFDMTIQQNNQAITITFTDGSTTSCTAQGTYWQAGRMGDIQATEVCANGVTETLHFYEIESTQKGFTARYVQHGSLPGGQSCSATGVLAGVRR